MTKQALTLTHGNIYKSINGDLYAFICETNIKSKICVTPIKENDNTSEILILSSLKKVAYLDETKEIHRGELVDILRIKGKCAKLTIDEYITISNHVICMLNEKTKNTYLCLSNTRSKSNIPEYILTEDYYKYLTWFDYKTKLNFQKTIKRNPGILKFGVYYAELGENVGSELHKLRPVIIFKKCVSEKIPDQTSYIVIPITSKSTSGKYAFNPPIIVNGKINYVRINDIRRISVKRIASPLYISGTQNTYVLSEKDRELVIQKFTEYFVNKE